MERATILYDGDCGFCRWALARILAWDRRRALRPVALHDPEAHALLATVRPEARGASWHLVLPEGAVRSGGAAVPDLARLLPGGAPIAALAGRFPRATDRAYRWVAAHRGRLGRLVGERACSR